MSKKKVYIFSKNRCEGNASMKDCLGGKGANLAEMCLLGIPVPPGFTISTEACKDYLETGSLSPDVQSQIYEGIKILEEITGSKFGGKKNLMLFSVRSGSPVSMPGMMDTILNIGINDDNFDALIELGGKNFACDTYVRLIKMYSSVVNKVSHGIFEDPFLFLSNEKDPNPEVMLHECKNIVKSVTGEDFTQDLHKQLFDAITCVFASCNNERATEYKRIHNMKDNPGTAVNVQVMVFGNINELSATGVSFTRNPSTGEKVLWGEFLACAQGEDIVSGTGTPSPFNGSDEYSMEKLMPLPYAKFTEIAEKLEKHYRDMQDIEFTIQNEKLYILQTRSGKRSPIASIKIAVDMCEEGLISKTEALSRITPENMSGALHPVLNQDKLKGMSILCKGLPASPGAASGQVAFNLKDVESIVSKGIHAILVRKETSPEDIKSMYMSSGILTSKGGMTSHAAVVARGIGKPCICGTTAMNINETEAYFTVGCDKKIYKNEFITINGTTGEVIVGVVETVPSMTDEKFAKLLDWANETGSIRVRANADTPEDSKTARKFFADGIGLCRTEHMFFNEDRIETVQGMIMAETKAERKEMLDALHLIQKEDFKKIFFIMSEKSVTVRLLDLPLHEFLPKTDDAISKVASKLGKSVLYAQSVVCKLTETNPMLGHRGCRLAISYPEIYEAQVHAIMSASKELLQEEGITCKPEIMIPLVMNKKEVIYLKEVIDNIASDYGIDYKVGTMIELPKAALIVDEFAEFLDFVSFGTNDLTQTTLGISRDDSQSFLGDYKKAGIIDFDPFQTLDPAVCILMKNAIKLAKSVNPQIKIGICGEHGGDPKSIEWCIKNGVDYVSCSPYRVPEAKIVVANTKN